jgi:hypothetical protein
MRMKELGGLYTPGGYIHPAFYYEDTDVVYRTGETVFYIIPGGGLWSVDSMSNTDIVIPNIVEIILKLTVCGLSRTSLRRSRRPLPAMTAQQ